MQKVGRSLSNQNFKKIDHNNILIGKSTMFQKNQEAYSAHKKDTEGFISPNSMQSTFYNEKSKGPDS